MHVKMAKNALVVAVVQDELEKVLAKVTENIPVSTSWI